MFATGLMKPAIPSMASSTPALTNGLYTGRIKKLEDGTLMTQCRLGCLHNHVLESMITDSPKFATKRSLYVSTCDSGGWDLPQQEKLTPCTGLWLTMCHLKLSLAVLLSRLCRQHCSTGCHVSIFTIRIISESFPRALRYVQETYPNFWQRSIFCIW